MIPTGSEFVQLYLLHGFILGFIIQRLIFKKRHKEFSAHLIFYLLYNSFMIYTFRDKESFSGGGSLVFLFYGYLFPFLHLLIYGIIIFIKSFRKPKL
jgi:hypothetical protein